MKNLISIMFMMFFCGTQIVFSQFPFQSGSLYNGVTTIICPERYMNKPAMVTEKSHRNLIDSSVYSTIPSFCRFDDNAYLISHEKYVKHQQELERINRIVSDNSDTLLIIVEFLNEKKELIKYEFKSILQINEYANILQLLFGNDIYFPLPLKTIQLIKEE